MKFLFVGVFVVDFVIEVEVKRKESYVIKVVSRDVLEGVLVDDFVVILLERVNVLDGEGVVF